MKKLLVFMMILLFILTGCNEKKLLVEQQGLHQSVLDYYQIDRTSYKSENLETKIELVKVETEENIYYRYLVAFVPIYFERMQFKNVQITYQNQEILDFIIEKVLFGQDIDSYMTLFPEYTESDWPAFENIEDFRSLIWATHFAVPKKTILESEYTIEQIDEMFSNFEVLITFNKFKDVLKVENLDMIVVQDSVDYNRTDINEMRKDNAPQTYFSSYTSADETSDHFIEE
ncbi:MAG TPA: hypothetical protein PLI19_02380 [Erysipelotrichaceae bacterium]|nr:hypothetical protein [Erysipelotrichaceae bacterium]HQB32157.1 hypothetical protein [Erysipelotrichaceae bacterium]